MYRISKTFMVSAAHKLDYLPKVHPCTRVHGHDYHITIFLEAKDEELNMPVGFIKDYRELAPFKDWLNEQFDHQFINDTLPPEMNPSAENMAKYIYDAWKDKLPVWGIEVKETPNTSALYYE